MIVFESAPFCFFDDAAYIVHARRTHTITVIYSFGIHWRHNSCANGLS